MSCPPAPRLARRVTVHDLGACFADPSKVYDVADIEIILAAIFTNLELDSWLKIVAEFSSHYLPAFMAFISARLEDPATFSKLYESLTFGSLIKTCFDLPYYSKWLRESPREVGMTLTKALLNWLEFELRMFRHLPVAHRTFSGSEWALLDKWTEAVSIVLNRTVRHLPSPTDPRDPDSYDPYLINLRLVSNLKVLTRNEALIAVHLDRLKFTRAHHTATHVTAIAWNGPRALVSEHYRTSTWDTCAVKPDPSGEPYVLPGLDDELKACARCQAVRYCGHGHQKQHWKKGGHKHICFETKWEL